MLQRLSRRLLLAPVIADADVASFATVPAVAGFEVGRVGENTRQLQARLFRRGAGRSLRSWRSS
jgi:hypothetical protein